MSFVKKNYLNRKNQKKSSEISRFVPKMAKNEQMKKSKLKSGNQNIKLAKSKK
jgi:hypothetical protein